MTSTTDTTDTIEQEAIEAYKVSAAQAALTAKIDYDALLDVGFDEEQAIDLIIAWHGKTIINTGH